MRRVLVFAEKILPRGQTFIPITVNALKRFQATYIGLTPVEPSAELSAPPILLTNGRGLLARIHKELYRLTAFAPQFYKRAAQENASLLHVHFAEGACAAVSLSRHLGIPFVMHLRGGAELYPDSALRKKLFEWSYLLWRRRLWNECSRFLCVSKYIRDKALAAGFPEDKLQVHYTGIEFSRFTPSDPPIERDRNMVLYVGRIVRYKGADHLVRAMSILRQQQPAAHLTIIGDGWFRPEVEALANELGVPCTFLGDRPPSVVREYMERARVFCAPSITLEDGMSEAFGNVFTEAQAMRLPVVAYRHGGIVETMLDGETGLLADERDIPTLAANLSRLLTDDALWSSFSQRGAAWVRQEFDVHLQTAKLEDLYEAVIHRQV